MDAINQSCRDEWSSGDRFADLCCLQLLNTVTSDQAVIVVWEILHQLAVALRGFRRMLLLQAAAFDIRQGSAYEALNPADGNLHYFTNGQNSYRGVEFSLTGYVTTDLALYATTTILSAHYENTHASPNINGFWIEGTPDNTWSLAGEYTVSWLTPALKLTAGAYHTGRQAINATNDAFTPEYTTFDVGGSYDLRMPRYELIFRLNGQNITDKRYWASTGSSVLAEGLPGLVKFSVTARL